MGRLVVGVFLVGGFLWVLSLGMEMRWDSAAFRGNEGEVSGEGLGRSLRMMVVVEEEVAMVVVGSSEKLLAS